MSSAYYFSIDAQPVGPLDPEDIRQRIAAGRITVQTLAWREGMTEWRAVASIPELMTDFGGPRGAAAAPPPQSGSRPPPLPPARSTPPPDDAAGRVEIGASAYRFVMGLYRPWGGRSPPVREYVRRNPKRALPVALATLVVPALAVAGFFASFEPPETPRQAAGQPTQAMPQMPPPMAGGDFREQYRIQRDLHRYKQSAIDDWIKRQQRADERRLEMDRHRYDWYRKED